MTGGCCDPPPEPADVAYHFDTGRLAGLQRPTLDQIVAHVLRRPRERGYWLTVQKSFFSPSPFAPPRTLHKQKGRTVMTTRILIEGGGALGPRRLVLTRSLRVPDEAPAEHVRNALMILRGLEATAPAFYRLNPELDRAERCARHALTLIGTPHARQHVERAVEALVAADLDWGVVTDVRAAAVRLLQAFFLLAAP